ncbi:GH92 family glycosyl hydrolase [Marinilabilia sp.]
MKILKYLAFAFLISLFASCNENIKKVETVDILSYVDPMIGTDGDGRTFPGATTPLGMIQLSPTEQSQKRIFITGYHYSNLVIKGFAHNHFSGTGLGAMADFLLMPTSGEIQMNPGTIENPDAGYRSRYSHDNESASAGYYSVLLSDHDVNVELTATPRVGFHRYTYNNQEAKNIIIDPTHNIREGVKNVGVEILSDTEIRGFKQIIGGACGPRNAYFYAKFSQPFSNYGLSIGDSIIEGDSKVIEGKFAKAFVSFDKLKENSVEVALALSYVDYEGAKANFMAEATNKNFDQVHEEAKEMWRKKISKIEFEEATVEQKRILYTGLYHSFIAPNIISDVNGNYIIEGKKYTSDSLTQYSNISTWDTYRATHPLWTIIDQKSDADIVNVLISRYTESDGGLALWEALGHDNCCMIGYSGISVMADAAIKNIKGFDYELAYDCMYKASFDNTNSSPNYGRDNGVDYYVDLAYVPAEVGCGVSKTTEYNYYDWCMAEMAKKLGKTDDEKLFRERSLGYRNLYNAETNYLWPRFTNGKWLDMDTTKWDGMRNHYISGNIWAYTGYTPHDMQGAIKLFGGKDQYANWLDMIFSTPIEIEGEQHVDISGFVGKYGHGDEPGHQMPYSYNFVQQPWKTQKLVRDIMKTMYSDKPNGFINNEDCGQMSSWYIFSALGFYPVCPGDLKYYIGSPIVKKAKINLENGNQFMIKSNNNSDNNIYIQSVKLNGEEWNKPFIYHNDIMNGGELVFEMGPEPNRNWGMELN